MKTSHIYFVLSMIFFIISFSSCSTKSFIEREISFKNEVDGILLSGTLTIPDTSDKVPAVVLIHGSGPHNRDLEFFSDKKLFKDLAEFLSNNGIAVLRYDKRGVGKSEGQFVPFDLDHFKNDGIAGVQYLKTVMEVDTSKIGVIGISQGGLIVPMMAGSCRDIDFAVLLGSPGIGAKDLIYSSQLAITKAAGFNDTEIKEMTSVFDSLWPLLRKEKLQAEEEYHGKELLKNLWRYIDMPSRNDFGFLDGNVDFWFSLYRGEMVRKFYDYDPAQAISQMSCPVLAVSGDKDVQAPPGENLTAIRKALQMGKCDHFDVIELKNHNHIFQKCETGSISEYKKIKGTMSRESLDLIKEWIIDTTNSYGPIQ